MDWDDFKGILTAILLVVVFILLIYIIIKTPILVLLKWVVKGLIILVCLSLIGGLIGALIDEL